MRFKRVGRRRPAVFVVFVAAVLLMILGSSAGGGGAIRSPAPEPEAPKATNPPDISGSTRTSTPRRRSTSKVGKKVAKKTTKPTAAKSPSKRTRLVPCRGKSVGLLLTGNGQPWAAGAALGFTNCVVVPIAVPAGDAEFRVALARGLVPKGVVGLLGRLSASQQRELAPILVARKIPYLEVEGDVPDDVAVGGFAFQLTASYLQTWFTLPDLLTAIGGSQKIAFASSSSTVLDAFQNYTSAYSVSPRLVGSGESASVVASFLLGLGADTIVVAMDTAIRDREVVAAIQTRSYAGRVVVGSDIGANDKGVFRLSYRAPSNDLQAEFAKAFPGEPLYFGAPEGYDAAIAMEEAITASASPVLWFRKADAVGTFHNFQWEGGLPVHPKSFLYLGQAEGSFNYLASAAY